MKKILFFGFVLLAPLALFANADVDSDIKQRTVNFLIFGAIIYYLLADKLKDFFTSRTKSIQAKLDEVQTTLEESEQKVQDAKDKVESAKQLAIELVNDAKSDVSEIKTSVEMSCKKDIAYLEKSFDDKIELERKKANKETINEVLADLFNDSSVKMSQENLSNVILKKVA